MVMQAGSTTMADYSMFLALGMPKQGQTLEEVRDLALGEMAKLRAGDFSDELISSTINNLKLEQMESLENNASRAQKFVQAFINGIEWKDAAKDLERYSQVTKQDVVDFANKYLLDNNYVIVYKRQGIDTNEKKIEAPAITPIATNRDKKSAFLTDVENSSVKPIEPVFVDFSKDMSETTLCEGVNLLYKKNDINGIGRLSFVFNKGTEDDPALNYAIDYISYLGTPEMSAEQIATKLYDLACNFSMGASPNSTTIHIEGLNENLGEATKLVESLISGAVADENILANMKADALKNRTDGKLRQQSCFAALNRYISYGSEFIKKTTLSNQALAALTSEELLAKARDLVGKGHEILYYGPSSEAEIKATLNESHKVGEKPEALPEHFAPYLTTPESKVILVNYDSKQLNYTQKSNRGETFDASQAANIELYNNYFGSGMNSIVFQEMREARALAYSANARLSTPQYKEGNYVFSAYIGTQNDKLQKAVEGFDEIINDMPVSENAFNIAKENLLTELRTKRTTGMSVLDTYRECRRLGISEPLDKEIFTKVQELTLDDVVATQQKWVKDRTYNYAILGKIADLDLNFLKTLGPVQTLSLEEIFGY